MRFKNLLFLPLFFSFLFSCKSFDPYATLDSKQIDNILKKARSAEKAAEQPCKKLTTAEINELLQNINTVPEEPVTVNEVAVLETNFGPVILAFYPDKAPKHCASFKRLVNAGFYDCTRFHRIIPEFVIQGGDILTRDEDPFNDGTGGPGYNLPAEFNDLQHGAGILSMARAQDINSAGSQFFICLSRERTNFLDGKYTVFGKVIGGMENVLKIAAVPTAPLQPGGEPSSPVQDVYISRAFMVKR